MYYLSLLERDGEIDREGSQRERKRREGDGPPNTSLTGQNVEAKIIPLYADYD